MPIDVVLRMACHCRLLPNPASLSYLHIRSARWQVSAAYGAPPALQATLRTEWSCSCRHDIMQGFALAKRLHDDAVGRGAIMALAPGLAVPTAFQAAASSLPVRACCFGKSLAFGLCPGMNVLIRRHPSRIYALVVNPPSPLLPAMRPCALMAGSARAASPCSFRPAKPTAALVRRQCQLQSRRRHSSQVRSRNGLARRRIRPRSSRPARSGGECRAARRTRRLRLQRRRVLQPVPVTLGHCWTASHRWTTRSWRS